MNDDEKSIALLEHAIWFQQLRVDALKEQLQVIKDKDAPYLRHTFDFKDTRREKKLEDARMLAADVRSKL